MRWLAIVTALCLPMTAAAEHSHTVSTGESLESLAKQYYGAAWKAVYLAARNGIEDGARLTPRQRLAIPACGLYRVRRGDSFASIAKRFLGSADRYKVLMLENGLRNVGDLEVGTELLLPFVLRHVVKHGEGLSHIARRYYRNAHRTDLLIAYNGKSGLDPGERVLVPVFDRAALNVQSRQAATSATSNPTHDSGEDDRTAVAKQAALKRALTTFASGDLEQACAELELLLGDGAIATADEAVLVRNLAVCAVASGDREAAEDYFDKWLELDPSAHLDPILTSPKVLEVFEEVATRRAAVSP